MAVVLLQTIPHPGKIEIINWAHAYNLASQLSHIWFFAIAIYSFQNFSLDIYSLENCPISIITLSKKTFFWFLVWRQFFSDLFD
jgi:hypothetical protein